MTIDYSHSQNVHTLKGPMAAFPRLFPQGMPTSILDVGCGNGTWLRAASNLGVPDVFGVDGVETSPQKLLFDPKQFKRYDLTALIELGRRFEVVLCLEVAEHLEATVAPVLVESLTKHSDKVVFSAACPGQPGQHHVNCQWPEYWQALFNARGYACEDSLRWQIWSVKDIEPWYRQNLFIAVKDFSTAGKEERIRPVVHPDMNSWMFPEVERFASHLRQVEDGRMPVAWYFKVPMLALANKTRRRI
jgi:SAM-dependent methyltransferase